MTKVATGYYIDLVVLALSVAGLWVLFGMQALVYRFTPRKRWVLTRYGILFFGFLALLFQTARAVDPQTAFGRLSITSQHALTTHVTACLFDAGAVMLVANAQSLYKQIGRQAPKSYAPLLIFPAAAYHFAIVCTSIVEAVQYHQLVADPKALMTTIFVRRVCFDVLAVFLLTANNILFYFLYRRVASFADTLGRMNKRVAGATTTPAATAAASPTNNRALAVKTRGLGGEAVVTVVTPQLVIDVQPVRDDVTSAPTPMPLLSPSQATSDETPTGPTSSPPTSPTAQRQATLHVHVHTADAADSRLDLLHGALVKMRRIVFLLNFVLLLAIAVDVSQWTPFLARDYDLVHVRPSDPTKYTLLLGALQWLQQIMLYVLLWYTWSPIDVWSSRRTRDERATPFWNTLLHGQATTSSLEEDGSGASAKQAQYRPGGGGGAHAIAAGTQKAEPSAIGGTGSSTTHAARLAARGAPVAPNATATSPVATHQNAKRAHGGSGGGPQAWA